MTTPGRRTASADIAAAICRIAGVKLRRGLRDGAVRAVVSTNALELGIDIGALDVSVMAGYPGTIAATWQRAGRAGRRHGRSAAVMVASSAPLDQFIVRNPSYFFDASPERALIDPDNLHILVDHIKCAAFELPFSTSEEFGKHGLQEILELLAEQGLVHRSAGPRDGPSPDGCWAWTSESYPADAVSLRSVSSDNFVVVDTTRETRVIGETDFTSGPATLHPRAIYIVEGKLYQVERLDFEGRKAFVREIDCDYYTDAITYTRVTILDTFAETVSPTPVFRPRRGARGVARGRLQEDQVLHERERRLGRAGPAGAADAHDGVLADHSRGRTGVAAVCRRRSARRRPRRGVCDPAGRAAAADVRPSRHRHLDRYRNGVGTSPFSAPRIFIYDNYPGGIGFSEPLFRMHHELLTGTRRLIAECECENGCPGCVGPVGNTGPLAKAAALRILDLLLANRLTIPPWPIESAAYSIRRIRATGTGFAETRIRSLLPTPVPPNLESVLGGEWRQRDGASCFVVETRREPSSVLGGETVGTLAGRLEEAAAGAALVAGAPGPVALRVLRSRNDRSQRRRGHLRLPRRMRLVRR